MPWFKIDDSAHSHPKFRRAGNAALGLWLRCGAYSAQHLLEGIVPGDVARDYGTATQATKLVTIGLWHAVGHPCTRCPQPDDGDYVIHDFFEGGRNSTRAQVEAARRAATDRQAKARASANGKQKPPPNRDSFGGQTETQSGPDSPAECTPNAPRFQPSIAGQSTLSQRDTLNGVTPSQASPHQTVLLPSEEEPASSGALVRIGDRPRIPEASRPLTEQMTAAGMVVGWDLHPTEWLIIEAILKRCPIDHLVATAAGMWEKARSRPRSGNYFIPGWKALGDIPEGTPFAPAATAISRPQQETNDLFGRAMQRAIAKDQQEAS
jgi:hypothetical protein